MAASATIRRARARVTGTVQGVGFRPFVFHLAGELELAGWVRNDEHGVELEVEGPCQAVSAFLERLAREAPPLAAVERVHATALAPRGAVGFAILASAGEQRRADALVATDTATCAQCLAELADPRDRRHRYPFINCTNCGPRFTIVRGVPYDRRLTTMAGFAMCEPCRAEYEDPADRRFHAQPNACPRCGPQARLVGSVGREGAPPVPEGAHDAVAAAAQLIAAGAIVAVKGLGGYHLACRADEEEPVAALRARKHREGRPFALMAADAVAACALARLGEGELELLRSPARPIVLAPRRPGAPVADAVAPGMSELAVMLAYSPLHHLLLGDVRERGVEALVMTSGNISDEPIAYEDADALARLGEIADAFLLHDRPVHMRTDDSLARVVRTDAGARPQLLRRSRGHVPRSIALPVPAGRALLACGAELKSTFCLARDGRAWVSHHIGDLRNWETLCSLREGVEHFEGLFGVRSRLLAHDLHPDYLSSAYARERADREGLELLAVQHHHAHLAAVLAEHGERGPAVGAVYDGAGLGPDGTVWGGELLVGDLCGYERAGSLRPVRLPGGDRAAREPWRMACAWLAEAGGDPLPPVPGALVGHVDEQRWRTIAHLATGVGNAPLTTSVGRLFDAVAAICGCGPLATFEGQAAMRLEAIADQGERGRYELPFAQGELDARALVAGLLRDRAAGVADGVLAARFHNTLAAGTADGCVRVAREHGGVELAVLAGGVFQNRLLLEDVARRLERAGLRTLIAERLPPNDGAIAYGQAAVAAAVSRG